MFANLLNSMALLKVRADALLLDVNSILNEAKSAADKGGSTDDLTSKITEAGGGLYRIMFYVFIILAVIAVLGVAIMLLFSNSGTRQELKGKAGWIVAAVIIGASAVGIITAIASAGTGLFGDTGGGGEAAGAVFSFIAWGLMP